jgi:hypothetical protein
LLYFRRFALALAISHFISLPLLKGYKCFFVFLAFILQLRAEGLGQEPELELSNPVNLQKIAFTDFMPFPINVKK